jgi:hypothetical protein
MVVEVEHLARTVAEPGQYFSVGDVVVGAEAGEMMAEGMQLVLLRLFELPLLAQLLDPPEQGSLRDAAQHSTRAFLRRAQEQRHLRMHRNESLVFVLRCAA